MTTLQYSSPFALPEGATTVVKAKAAHADAWWSNSEVAEASFTTEVQGLSQGINDILSDAWWTPADINGDLNVYANGKWTAIRDTERLDKIIYKIRLRSNVNDWAALITPGSNLFFRINFPNFENYGIYNVAWKFSLYFLGSTINTSYSIWNYGTEEAPADDFLHQAEYMGGVLFPILTVRPDTTDVYLIIDTNDDISKPYVANPNLQPFELTALLLDLA